MKNAYFLLFLLLASLLSILAAISCGEVKMSSAAVVANLFDNQNPLFHQILWELRVPRALSAFTIGGLLALSGALLQVMLKNPLADPYILGAAGGAAVGSLLLIFIGVSGFWINGGAFFGALVSMGLVFLLAPKRWSSLHLLLTGIAIASLWGALISLILSLSIDKELPSMLFWLIGDLSYTPDPFFGLAALALGLLVTFLLAPKLNILSQGEIQARTIGVDTNLLNWQLYFLTAFLVACAVSMAGCIGFVGLIVPHFLRLLGYSNHRALLPASVLLGGILLTCCDTISRIAFAPLQLPVGALTALLGAPFFLYLLNRNRPL